MAKQTTKNAQKAAAKKRRLFKLELVRIVEYMVSGGAYFWSGYLAFFVIDKGLGGSFFWAKSISTLTGWTVNYLLQRYWVFRNPKLAKNQPQVTGRFIIITLVDFVLDYIIVYELKVHGVTPYIGQFVSAGFFTVWNYIWYRAWVFSTHSHHHLHHAIKQERKRRAGKA